MGVYAAAAHRAIRSNLFFRTSKKGFPLLSLTLQIEFTKKKITFFLIEGGNIAYNFTQVAYGTISLKLSPTNILCRETPDDRKETKI